MKNTSTKGIDRHPGNLDEVETCSGHIPTELGKFIP
jgi:hypothetical protein